MFKVSLEQIQQAYERVRYHVLKTPLNQSETLSAIADRDLYLKFENLQFTASFKERGSVNKLLLLDDVARQRGVIAASAGNHAQALSRHCQLLGIPARIVMPKYTPNTKVENTKIFGAEVILEGERFDESMRHAIELQEQYGYTLVHPFDDLDVIAGQGTIGLELLDQEPRLETVVVPIGGGGLISGIASAIKQLAPNIRIVGVQVETFMSAYARFHGISDYEIGSAMTVAEGIAVKQPGEFTFEIIQNCVDDIVVVSELDVENAMFMLLEIEKTVVEGAGAISLAAALKHPDTIHGRTAIIVSGGNVEMITLTNILQRGLVRSHRLVNLRVLVADVPGALAKLTRYLGNLDSNIVDIAHRRTLADSTLGAQPIDVLLHLCGEEQEDHVVGELRKNGYEVEVLES